MKIVNYDGIAKKGGKLDNYKDDPALPKWPFRMCIVGGSGCGKTNLLFNLLLNKDGIQYDNLVVVSPSLYQDKYRYLIDYFDKVYDHDKETLERDVKQLNKTRGKGKGLSIEDVQRIDPHILKKRLQTYDNLLHFKNSFDLDTCCKDERTLFVFDDVLEEKGQEAITSIFSRGRHINASCMYISQSYFSVPKNVRLNCTAYVLFKLNSRELKEVAQRVASDIEYKDFEAFFKRATSNKFGYVVIDESKPNNKYRTGFV